MRLPAWGARRDIDLPAAEDQGAPSLAQGVPRMPPYIVPGPLRKEISAVSSCSTCRSDDSLQVITVGTLQAPTGRFATKRFVEPVVRVHPSGAPRDHPLLREGAESATSSAPAAVLPPRPDAEGPLGSPSDDSGVGDEAESRPRPGPSDAAVSGEAPDSPAERGDQNCDDVAVSADGVRLLGASAPREGVVALHGAALPSPCDKRCTEHDRALTHASLDEIRAMLRQHDARLAAARAASAGQIRIDTIAAALQNKLGTRALSHLVEVLASASGQSPHSVLLGTPEPMPYILTREPAIHAGANGIVAPVLGCNGSRLVVKFYKDAATLDAELALLEAEQTCNDIPKLMPQVFDYGRLTHEGAGTAFGRTRSEEVCTPASTVSSVHENRLSEDQRASEYGGSDSGTVTPVGSGVPAEPFATGYIISARGKSLADILRTRSFADAESHFTMGLYMKLLSILGALHAAKRIHGNLTPGHTIVMSNPDDVMPEFLVTDLSCSRKVGEEAYAPWGAFDVRFAAPEVVAAALSGSAAVAQPAADVWSLGLVLYEITQGRPYWPHDWSVEVIVEALLGRRALPHTSNESFLQSASRLTGKIQRMLQLRPSDRASLRDLMHDIARHLEQALTRHPSTVEEVHADWLQQELGNLHEIVTASTGSHEGADGVDRAGPAAHRDPTGLPELASMHRLVIGQNITITLQLYRQVEGEPSKRRLCPIGLGDHSNAIGNAHQGDRNSGHRRPRPAAAGEAAPVFQLVQGEEYHLAVLVQNRDLGCPTSLPFEEVTEVRILPRDQRQALRVKPKVLESNEHAWWGEGKWRPTSAKMKLFDDCSQTSNRSPGECKVYIFFKVPHMEGQMRLSRRLYFNMHPPGTRLAAHKAYTAVVDYVQNPHTAKMEMVKTGLQFAGQLCRCGPSIAKALAANPV